MGLIRNRAGYKVYPIEIGEERDSKFKDYIYKIETNLPCHWIGKLTAVTRTQIN